MYGSFYFNEFIRTKEGGIIYKLFYEKYEDKLFKEGQYPDIVSILTNDFSNGVVYKSHLHTYPEILLILDGHGEHSINGKKYSVKKGDIVILNENTLHAESSGTENPIKVITCMLSNVYINGLEENHIIPEGVKPVISCGEYWEEVSSIFRTLYSDKVKNKRYCFELAQLNVVRLIYYIYRIIHLEPIQSENDLSILTQSVKAYLDENYDKEISLDSLAARFFASSFYISHEMKRELGISPINYQINRRIGEAQRNLLLTNKTIEEIARMVGYDNVSYFNRLFLKKTGCTPAKFREFHISDKIPPSQYVSMDNILALCSNDEEK